MTLMVLMKVNYAIVCRSILYSGVVLIGVVMIIAEGGLSPNSKYDVTVLLGARGVLRDAPMGGDRRDAHPHRVHVDGGPSATPCATP